MEIILAIRAALRSSRIRRRLPSAICFRSPNFDRRCAAFFSRATRVSSKRPAASGSAVATRGNWRRSGPWISFRADGNGGRNISHAAIAVLPVGTHPSGGSSFGVIHLGKLDRWAGWVLYKSSFNSFAGPHPRRSRDRWRPYRLPPRQQAACCPSDFSLSGNSPPYRRNKINFHEVGTTSDLLGRAMAVATALWAVSVRSMLKQITEDRPQVGGYSSFNFGAVSGDQGLVL